MPDAALERTRPDCCPSCDTPLQGRYCHLCGEKAFDPRDHSLAHFAAESLDAFTHLDGKFLKSLVLLCWKPGQLTSEYLAGRKRAYMKPLAVFIVANVVFFLSQTLLVNTNTFNTSFQSQVYWQPYSAWTRAKVEAKLAGSQATLADYAPRFNARSEELARTLIVFQVPLLALLMRAAYARSGRSFVDHLIFSTHYYAFVLYVNVLIAIGVFANLKLGGNDYSLGVPVTLAMALYLFLALHRVYPAKVWATLVRSVFLMAGVIGLVGLYRLALFFLTLHWVPA